MPEGTTTAFDVLSGDVGGVITDIGSIGTWFWTLFSSVLGFIQENAIIFVPVLLTVGGAAVLLCIRVVRKFGIRGRR